MPGTRNSLQAWTCQGIFELLFPSVHERFLEVRLTGQSISEIIPSPLSNDARCRTDALHGFELYFPYKYIVHFGRMKDVQEIGAQQCF